MNTAQHLVAGVLLILVVVIVMLLTGCSDKPSKREVSRYVAIAQVIPDDRRADAAAWITATVAAANPHSDEEPEDNIAQAEETASALFGIGVYGIRSRSNGEWVFRPYDACTPEERATIDAYVQDGSAIRGKP